MGKHDFPAKNSGDAKKSMEFLRFQVWRITPKETVKNFECIMARKQIDWFTCTMIKMFLGPTFWVQKTGRTKTKNKTNNKMHPGVFYLYYPEISKI